MLKIIIHLGILISILKENQIIYSTRKKKLIMMAPYPNITRVPSSQGSGKTAMLLPSVLLCTSIYHNTTEIKKQALQNTTIFEIKRMGGLMVKWINC